MWVGSESRTVATDLGDSLHGVAAKGVSVALGEPSKDMRGFRLTHRQAQAALLIALRGRNEVVQYTDHMLLAAVVQDATLARSLEEVYLAPLANHNDGGCAWRTTLRAYFEARGNAATAAAALGVDRSTVRRRLDEIEQRLGCMVDTCRGERWISLFAGTSFAVLGAPKARPAIVGRT